MVGGVGWADEDKMTKKADNEAAEKRRKRGEIWWHRTGMREESDEGKDEEKKRDFWNFFKILEIHL